MNGYLFTEGVNLMTLGMGFVFTFLVFLVFTVKGMSYFLERIHPTSTLAKKTHKKQQKQDENQLIAVLSAAVHHHQQNS
ncbi:oxaloacetate decarboxylase [Vibrio sp. V27_P1S3P104]|uniref:OadG family protein n=1 Tax=unclassified Vibrio TaxID=2614977 RepID=UPI00137288D6|nr:MULTISPECIES: OadG family protein [unclassified Vibrio]NAW70226.1 oxaloacetate decarboxylase [Vibrio sp. V28_P6S34P95]NAX04486.1 oxaloacetate decarboxylase [Vibrio sp. V30_P3S12P165]NAX33379.1 oxaloacetate decarboxylase [Vibrio sp. V29_P1S30P107]NAX36091.1 oxaloacetate decarboxylase [Vibrio sp. V27_P1S3P104]